MKIKPRKQGYFATAIILVYMIILAYNLYQRDAWDSMCFAVAIFFTILAFRKEIEFVWFPVSKLEKKETLSEDNEY